MPPRHACPIVGDKLFAIPKSLIILSILDGSGHIYMGFVLKRIIRIWTHITFMYWVPVVAVGHRWTSRYQTSL